jgi:hypothetical protein
MGEQEQAWKVNLEKCPAGTCARIGLRRRHLLEHALLFNVCLTV